MMKTGTGAREGVKPEDGAIASAPPWSAQSIPRRAVLRALGSSAAGLFLARTSSALGHAGSDPDVARDPLRPDYHLLAPHNWMNDPNGPIWWKGRYHLFYQLNPGAAVWGDMHWGHAVSPDMVHWRHQPVALAPTPGGPDSEGCFSGSAVVENGRPTFIYTGVRRSPPDQVTLHDGNDTLRETQLVAIADDDDLLRWTKYPEPAIALPPPGIAVTGFRDPCPWREGDTWYVGIGSGERTKGGCVLLYRSTDLRHWEYLNKLVEGRPNGRVAQNPCDSGEMWECPDFFALGDRHCLLYSSEGKVFWTTGHYDPQSHRYEPRRTGILDHGAYYAPKSFLAPDGRRILWGWIQETRPQAQYAQAGWAGAMSLPRVLSLGDQGELRMSVAAESESLRGKTGSLKSEPGRPARLPLTTLGHELLVPVDPSAGSVAVRLLAGEDRLWEVVVDFGGNAIRSGNVSMALPSLPWPQPSIHLFFDGSVIECFIAAREAITGRVYAVRPGETTLEVAVTGGPGLRATHWNLSAISPDRLAT